MRANLGAIGKNITVFDGKRGQIIYTKEEGQKVRYTYLMCLVSILMNLTIHPSIQPILITQSMHVGRMG
jgi:hypothetical protein